MVSRKKILSFIVFVMIMGVLPGAVLVAPPEAGAGQVYVVQADDWLGTLADKFYGDPLAYPVIVEATNARASRDDRVTPVNDPGHISIGQVLFIPSFDEIPKPLLAKAPLAKNVMPADPIVAHSAPTKEQLRLLAGLDVKGVPPELYNEVWLNSKPLKLANLQGKVVLLEFWTFG